MSRPEGFTAIIESPDFARVHYALVLASSAAALNRPTLLFFTGRALPAMLGTAEHPGWYGLEGGQAAARDAAIRASGVVGIEELFSVCVRFSVTFQACEGAMRAAGVAPAALRADLNATVGGAVGVLAASRGQLIFV